MILNINLSPEHQQVEKAFQQFRENRSREQRQDEEQTVKKHQPQTRITGSTAGIGRNRRKPKAAPIKSKQIQTEWKAIGPVPEPQNRKQLWNSYHALLDIFYNNRSIFLRTERTGPAPELAT